MWNPSNSTHCKHVMPDPSMRVNRKTTGSPFLESTYNKTTWASYNYGGFLGAFYNKTFHGGFLGVFSRTLIDGSHVILSIFTTDCHCKISLNWSFNQFYKVLKKHKIEMVMKTLICVGQKKITSVILKMEIWYPQKLVKQEYYGFLLSQEQSWL